MALAFLGARRNDRYPHDRLNNLLSVKRFIWGFIYPRNKLVEMLTMRRTQNPDRLPSPFTCSLLRLKFWHVTRNALSCPWTSPLSCVDFLHFCHSCQVPGTCFARTRKCRPVFFGNIGSTETKKQQHRRQASVLQSRSPLCSMKHIQKVYVDLRKPGLGKRRQVPA